MLNYFITYIDGSQAEISNIISVVFNSDYDVPADDLTVVFPCDKDFCKKADMISAMDNDKPVFIGKIDDIIHLSDKKSAVTKIVARSLASILLDNEAEPVTYFRPSADFIFDRHLKPFGFSEFVGDCSPYCGTLKVEKGMSCWSLLKLFCNYKFACNPRITGNGKVIFNGVSSDKKIVFGNGGIDYVSIKESVSRCKLISKVMLRMSDNGSYSSALYNDNPDCKGINRIRYYNATTASNSISTADRIIKNSNADSYCVMLECIGCFTDILCCRAVVDDRFCGVIDGLYVKSIKYTTDSNGEFTTVVLGKEFV